MIPPGSLVTTAPGVPHTWTACPAGVKIPTQNENNGVEETVISDGKFLMLFEYEQITGFFPTAQTKTLSSVENYVRCEDLESIRIPALTADQVRDRCWFVRDENVWRVNKS